MALEEKIIEPFEEEATEDIPSLQDKLNNPVPFSLQREFRSKEIGELDDPDNPELEEEFEDIPLPNRALHTGPRLRNTYGNLERGLLEKRKSESKQELVDFENEQKQKGIFRKIVERPISGISTVAGAFYNKLTRDDIGNVPLADIIDHNLNAPSELEKQGAGLLLEKGLEGFSVVLTMPGEFINGVVAAEETFDPSGLISRKDLNLEGLIIDELTGSLLHPDAIQRGLNAASRRFVTAFSLEDAVASKMITEGLIKEAERDSVSRSLSEFETDLFQREMREGREVSEAKFWAFAGTSVLTKTAEVVVGGGGIKATTQSTLTIGKFGLYTVPKALIKSPILLKDGIVNTFKVIRGGNTGAFTRINEATAHGLKSLSTRWTAAQTRIGIAGRELEKMRRNLKDIKGAADVDPKTIEVLVGRIKAYENVEKATLTALSKIEKEILSRSNLKPKKLTDMMDLYDEYQQATQAINNRIAQITREATKEGKLLLEEGKAEARLLRSQARNIRSTATETFRNTFGKTPKEVASLRRDWEDMLSFLQGTPINKMSRRASLQALMKRAKPFLDKVTEQAPKLRREQLLNVLRRTFEKATKVTVPKLNELSKNVKDFALDNASVASQAEGQALRVIAKAYDKSTALGEEAIAFAVQERGGLANLQAESLRLFGKDITALGKKQIRELAKFTPDEINDMKLAFNELTTSEVNMLGGIQKQIESVFGVKFGDVNRISLMNDLRDYREVLRQTEKAGTKISRISKELKQLSKEFKDDHGMTPDQFLQFDALASDLSAIPWYKRFTKAYVGELDDFVKSTEGIKVREWKRLINDEKIVRSSFAQAMGTVKNTFSLETVRSFGSRLKALDSIAGKKVVEVKQARDTFFYKTAARFQKQLKDIAGDLTDIEKKAWKAAMEADTGGLEAMQKAVQVFKGVRMERVIEAAKKGRDLEDAVFELAKEVGVEVASKMSGHFPRVYRWNDLFLDDAFRARSVENLFVKAAAGELKMADEELDFLLRTPPSGDAAQVVEWQQQYAELVKNIQFSGAREATVTNLTRENAGRLLQNLAMLKGSRASGNLTKSRKLIDSIAIAEVEDPINAMRIYLEKSAATISDVMYYGKNDASIKTVLKSFRNGTDIDATKLFYQMEGVATTSSKLTKGKNYVISNLKALQVPKLWSMSLANAPEGIIASMWHTNMGSATKALFKAFTAEGKEWARNSGALFNNTQRQMAIEMGITGEMSKPLLVKMADKFLIWNGADATETFGRTVGALASKYYLDDAIKFIKTSGVKNVNQLPKKFKSFLDDAGVNSKQLIDDVVSKKFDRLPNVLDDLRLDVGQKMARLMLKDPNGIYTREALKQGWSSIILQYKRWGIDHTRNMWQILKRIPGEVFDPNLSRQQQAFAASDIIGKLMAHQLTGHMVTELRYAIYQNLLNKDIERPENVFAQMLQNMTAMGGLGIVTDMMWASSSKFQLTQQFIGPTISDITDFGAGLNKTFFYEGKFEEGLSEMAAPIIEKIPIPFLNKKLEQLVKGE